MYSVLKFKQFKQTVVVVQKIIKSYIIINKNWYILLMRAINCKKNNFKVYKI